MAYLAANEAVTRRFFLVFQYESRMKARSDTLQGIAERLREEEQTARRYLELCGLEVVSVEYADNFQLELLYSFTIEVTADDADTLEQRVSGIETLCISLDMVAKRCDYRHEKGFLSSLLLLALAPDIEWKSRRNALTTGVAAAFPFSSFEICGQSGIMLGLNLHNRSVCMLDIFDSSKYSNAGMLLMGMSGAGKTFLLQLIASRLRQQADNDSANSLRGE